MNTRFLINDYDKIDVEKHEREWRRSTHVNIINFVLNNNKRVYYLFLHRGN